MIQDVKTTINTKKHKKYTFDEVFKASKDYFNGDELAATTWMNKYALKNAKGEYLELTPADMHKRMAKMFGRIEQKYSNIKTEGLSEYGQKRDVLTEQKIFNLFDKFKYVIPQGSIMYGLGNDQVIASLSNCVVIPAPHDSYGGIMYTDQQL
ncbi:MAG TPA: ribonucleoside-diphosphate reductase, adenosylcobalamin-dependent, partial [Flavobacteriales bacterium]|nr:ribonucleoside-diphosphate reductase, adenosylcobalamin-dependent [Flavobacteriales bacterium]